MIATYPNTELESLTFDRDSGTYRAEFDQQRTSASAAVTALLSAVRDCAPIELSPLYESVDPDALDSLTRVRSGTNGDVTVSFTVGEDEITVYSYGTVAVTSSNADGLERSTEQPALD
ncbi:hypothetical protein SAMN05216559_3751 [Halomicrobium zhouii]|uniref:Halobacterial output domain-containing protein n=1 Tax=Halomicrobium zhouii TaxID=767519 RepID=A0A1I6M4B9_9EURY|nr:HalOD1 output domain-containing protein [Halomicrobium zhouii]SFS10530.1 hypothetical protein SAMN05216559_3751 [Halomicrobium zhouii]